MTKHSNVIDEILDNYKRSYCEGARLDNMSLVASNDERFKQSLATELVRIMEEAIANPDFVYEIMNAPTNGAGVNLIRTRLTAIIERELG